MVYYGLVSRGCQRCRQRKIKCDEKKPGCQRCQKAGVRCPGYRDLKDVLFRNESDRIIRKFNKSKSPEESSPEALYTPKSGSSESALTSPGVSTCILAPFSQSTDDLAANFFFAKYLPKETLIAKNFHDWLGNTYLDNTSSALSAIVQAIGMAGLSNIYPAAEIAVESRRRHHQALWGLKQALDDPIKVTSDETLTTVNLLSLYETVNSQSTASKLSLSHIEGSMALLQLRGQNQYTYERGGHLVALTCTRVLQVCLQNKQIVPLPMVQATTNWQSSALRQEWSRQKHSHPGSLSEISFRLVNLLALLKTGEISDPTAIHRLVHEIDYDLQTWGEVVPTNWNYMIVDDQAGFENPDLPLKSHIYPNLRVAEDWNNMRIQRITVNRVLLRFSDKFCFPVLQAATAIIKQLSLEICASISSLRDSPHSVSLIMPLYIMSIEQANSRAIRLFAMKELGYLGATMGLRKAAQLGELAAERLNQY